MNNTSSKNNNKRPSIRRNRNVNKTNGNPVITGNSAFGVVGRKDKFADTRIVQAVSTTGSIVQWTPPPQGVQAYNRVGDTIDLTSLEMLTAFQYGDAIGNFFRFIVIQTRGGFIPATVADLLAPGATASVDITSPFLQYLPGNKIEVLKDVLMTLTPGSQTAQTCYKELLPIKVKQVEFVQSTSTVQDGSIFFIFLADSAVIPHPTADVMLRVIYKDA